MPKKREAEFIIRARNLTRRALRAVGTDVNKLGKQVKQFNAIGGRIKAVGQQVSAVGRQMTIAAGIMTAAIALPTKAAADFETGMARVSTLLDGDLTRTTEMYGETVKQMAVDTNQSVKILNDALYQAVSAGVDAGDAMEFMDVAAKAATGGFTDVRTAVDGLTTVMNSYQLETKDALRVADQMNIAVKYGKTTFGELSGSIGRAAAMAANFGVASGDLLSAVAVMTKAGISTEEAVTAARALLVSISKPSDDAAAALDALQRHIPVADRLRFSITSLQDRGFLNYFQTLIQLTGGSAEAMNALLGTNVRAAAGFFNLANQAEIFTTVAEEMKAAGTGASLTLRNFETVSGTAGFQLGQLGKEFKNILIELGAAFIPTLQDLAAWLKPIIASTVEWIKENRPLITTLGKIVMALTAVFAVVGPVLVAVGTLAGAVGAVAAAGPALLVVGKALLIIVGLVAGLMIVWELLKLIVEGIEWVVKWLAGPVNPYEAMGGGPAREMTAEDAEALGFEFEPIGETAVEPDIKVGAAEGDISDFYTSAEADITAVHREEEKKRTKASALEVEKRLANLKAAGAKAKGAAAITLTPEQYQKLQGRFWLGASELAEFLGARGVARKAAAPGPSKVESKREVNIGEINVPAIDDPLALMNIDLNMQVMEAAYGFHTAGQSSTFVTGIPERERQRGAGGEW